MDLRSIKRELVMAAKHVGDRSIGDSSRAYTPTGEEETIVGFEGEVTIIKEQLTGVPKQLDVISIVGMAGIGKTTLAIKVYNDPLVQYHFHIRAWITVSQAYVKRDLLCNLLNSVKHHSNDVDQMSDKEINKMSDEELAQRLYQSLKGRRYFIVMDDIWDSRVWVDLKTCFPDDSNGSRIMFTSRYEDVASLAKSSRPPLSLRFLTDDESWVLFQQKVFRRGTCPPQFTKIGKHIAKKCQGVPLVIVVVAGILTNEEKSPDQWEKVGKTLNSQTTADPQIWLQTLALSYNHLPHHLKPCFLYFGVFLEDYQVPVRKLIWLWVAEGFIRETEGKSMEDVAEEYLMELIGRSLVLVFRRRSDGGVKACGIHDLLRDFCIKQAEKESFLQGIFLEPPISYFAQSYVLVNKDSPRMSITKSELDDLDYQGYEFVRVLRTSDVMISSNCSKIEKLVHLRFLEIDMSFSGHYLPTTISNLKNLETLIINTCDSVTLPHCIRGMVTLRHLHFTGKRGTVRIEKPGAIYPFSLDNLQTLTVIAARSCRDFLAGTPNIRKLGIRGYIVKNGLFTYPDTDFLNHLQELKLWCGGIWYLPVRLGGVRFSTNLKKLTLMETQVTWNEMSTLGKSLPNLEVLKLLQLACVGKFWKTSDGDFPQLKFLELVIIPIEEWQVSSNPFPRLQRLVLVGCCELQSIPSEIGEVPTLQMIEVHDCNTSVANSAHKIKEEQVSMGNNWLQIVESGNRESPRQLKSWDENHRWVRKRRRARAAKIKEMMIRTFRGMNDPLHHEKWPGSTYSITADKSDLSNKIGNKDQGGQIISASDTTLVGEEYSKRFVIERPTQILQSEPELGTSDHENLQMHQTDLVIGTCTSNDESATGPAPEEDGILSMEEVDLLNEKKKRYSCKDINKILEDILLKAKELEETPLDPLEMEELQYDLMEVPLLFSHHFAVLCVVDLSYTSINSLPQSISRLIALKKLILRGCELLMELPPEIGELINLEVLDMEGTEVMYLPKEIAKLSDLMCLKVSLYCYANQYQEDTIVDTIIPRNALSNLSRLNELIIVVTPDGEWWDGEVEVIVNDLSSLQELRTLKLYLPTVELLGALRGDDTSLIFPALAQFRFTVGRHEERFISRLPHEVEEEFNDMEKFEKGLKYVNGEGIPGEIIGALKHCKAFFLERHWTVKSLSEFGHENMNKVKLCLLVECNELQTIIDAKQFYRGGYFEEIDSGGLKNGSEEIVLGSLQYLFIHYMKNMQSICKGPVGKGCLSNLKSFALYTCPGLTTLFTVEMLGNLINLEELVVEDCPKIDSLVSLQPSGFMSGLFLPSLKKISLLELPALVNISSGLCIAPKLERMVIFYCPKLQKLSTVEVSSANLKIIKGENEWWDSLKWYESDLSRDHQFFLDYIFVPLTRDGDLMAQLAED
ncbi:uncharacterized protein LOC130779693 [Actinidia eriantha]|uniref:uncharacterized protein LOC130779693 n=1 Tax=Actinidia eriantha TaxID=165200 RepID=UPI00258BE3EF|nr:uncharacterized protein LOC130779693 [Actinidia eriantha]